MKNVKISELVPFEKQLTIIQYEKAKAHLQADKTFCPPAKIFCLRIVDVDYTCVRDGHHHIRAALDLGGSTVPCEFTTPPDSVQGMRDHFEEHLALQGFANIPITSSRTQAITDDLKRDTTINFEALKRSLEENKKEQQ